MTRNGEPIEIQPPKRRVNTGIAYDDLRREYGWISEYEERDVALAYSYRWDHWLELPVPEREAHVAHHRIHQLVSIHSEEAVNEYARRQAERERNQR